MIELTAEHKYIVDGIQRPGFSEICADLGIIKDNPFWTEAGRDEGNALHEWLLFLAQGREPALAPGPAIAGRVAGIKKFLAQSGFRFQMGEEAQYEPESRYCCTPDLVGNMGGARVVIDAKRGAQSAAHRLQTAAQRMALEANGVHCRDRFALYLGDGDYKLIQHAEKRDELNWKTFVAAYYAKKSYGG